MVLNPESRYPSRRAFVLNLRADACVEALSGRLENLVTGDRHEFASTHELLAWLARELAETTTGGPDGDPTATER
jgi:hypothetical protein